MKELTTTEAAELWHITPRRVAMLAAAGRIPGAVCVGNRWYIPADAEKPADIRTKAARTYEKTARYIFPGILYTICNEHPASDLTGEEKELYEVFMQYESGAFEEGLAAAGKLLGTTENVYIRIGALYILSFFHILLGNYREASASILCCIDACNGAEDHREELALFAHELEAYTQNKAWIENRFTVAYRENPSDFSLAYNTLIATMRTAYRAGSFGEDTDPSTLELAVMGLEKKGFAFLSMSCHYYLACIYAFKKQEDRERMHLKRAFDIAVENRTYTSLSEVLFLAPDYLNSLLGTYPAEIGEKFLALSARSAAGYAGYINFVGGNPFFTGLTGEDYTLITYCLKKYTFEEIAARENISVSKAKRQMAALCKKLGVKGKAELVEAYTALANNIAPATDGPGNVSR